MKIILEENDYIDVTLKSIQKNCKEIEHDVVDSVQQYLESDKARDDKYVFILRGNSFKIITKKFERILNKTLPCASRIMLSRLYPGAYIKEGYDEAYKWNNISDPYDYDHDVALIDVEYFQNSDPSNRSINLLPYNLNAKDDAVSLKIVQPYMMMKRNAWLTKHAAVLNFSEELAFSDSVDAAIMYPYDILSPYVGRSKQFKPIKQKAKILTENFGKIKKLMVKYEQCK